VRYRFGWDDIDVILDGNHEIPEPEVLYREDGRGLFYPGRVNMLFGEDAVGKTWVELVAAKAVMDAGGIALHLDYDDTATTNIARLLALGCDRETIRNQYRHCTDPGKLDHERIDALVAEITAATGRPVLVIIDVLAEALVAHNLDENSAGDYVKWYRAVALPLARAGAAVILADHVPKNANGGYSRGSGAKRNKIDGVAYEVSAPDPLTREHGGTLALTIRKDRNGSVGKRGSEAALLIFTVEADRLNVRLAVPTPGTGRSDEDDLVALAVEAVKTAGRPMSGKALETGMQAKVRASAVRKRTAIATAVDRGALSARPGPRGAHLYAFVHDLHATSSDELATTSDDQTTLTSSLVSLLGDEDEDEVRDEVKELSLLGGQP
jgi:hypothetical protein